MHYSRENLARHGDTIRRAILPPLLTMAVLAFLLLWQVAALLTAVREVDRSDRVIAQADHCLGLLIDMETGERGYLVGAAPLFLQPYAEATPAIYPGFADLTRSVSDNPEQMRRVDAALDTYKTWHQEMQREMALRRRSGSAYITYFNLARGKELMDTLRDRITDIITAEQVLRDHRETAVERQTNEALIVGAISTLIVGSVIGFTSRRAIMDLSLQYEKTLDAEQQAREYLGATLSSIGDAVLVADSYGRITMLNPVAETLTGWTGAEAIGKDSKIIFDIANEETGLLVESPVERVLREGIVVGLANHTVLRRRDGTSLPIDDSGAPIRDKDGTLSGVVLVFRDVTERKQREQERAEAAAKVSRIAETLQQSLLLTPAPNAFVGLKLATFYEAASDESELGGDFFDAFAIDEHTVAIVVGDVTGKGLAAASFTAEVKFALRALLHEHLRLDEALPWLNRYLTDSQRLEGRIDSTLISLAAATIDTNTGRLLAAAAGAEPPLIVRDKTRTIEIVEAGGPLLGMDSDCMFDCAEMHLDEGDFIIMTTDGITEARKGRAFFGLEGVSRTVAAILPTSPNTMVEAVVRGAKEFAGESIRDDVCLIVARRNSSNTPAA